MSIRIVLVDDHEVVRVGLQAVLASREGLEIVGEASDGEAALESVRALSPDVVVMDISMPDLNGIQATRRILSEHPSAKVIILSVHADHRFVMGALRAGAVGYVPKSAAFEELERAVRAVAGGRVYLSPEVAGLVVEETVGSSDSRDHSAFSMLTDREREVLQKLAEGKTTKQAAVALGISDKTVETHRRNIMSKLGIHSIAGLTKYAIRQGITVVDG